MAQYHKSTQGKYSNWTAIIEHEPWSDAVNIWLAEDQHGKRFVASLEEGQIVMKEYKEGVQPKPLLKLSSFAWQAISQALSDAVTPVKQEIVDAELKASKYHLEDMRKLVFSKLESPTHDKH